MIFYIVVFLLAILVSVSMKKKYSWNYFTILCICQKHAEKKIQL